ncbi:hypothetical protein H5410_036218 [Solanum commersonii]|uniref:Uncharacterized protein n=1 Tax=Solanum commersonii TaxID=4109 RepID=A0A9J5Y4R8_SOLCO|nr:hypothetical protein H5410_036218 [Solanum commersonii]
MQENMLSITYALKSMRLLKHGAFLDLFISHVVNQPILVEERVPFEFTIELGVVQNSENSINRGSRVALGEHPQLIAEQTDVHPQLIARDAVTNSYITEQEETIDIRDKNVNAKEDDSDLPSNLGSSESELNGIPEEDDNELDEELRSFRTERRKKIHQNKKRKVPVPTLGCARRGWTRQSRDELDVLAQRGIDLLARRKSIKLRFDPDCRITIFELDMTHKLERRRRRKQFWRCAKASYEVKLKDELAKLDEGICEELLAYNKEF